MNLEEVETLYPFLQSSIVQQYRPNNQDQTARKMAVRYTFASDTVVVY